MRHYLNLIKCNFAHQDFIQIYGGDNENWKQTNGDKIFLENFLTEDEDGGLRFVVNESFIAFGVGRRDCVGRQLAMKEIQYTLGYLLMNYKLSLNEKYMNADITDLRGSNVITAFLDPQIPIMLECLQQLVFVELEFIMSGVKYPMKVRVL